MKEKCCKETWHESTRNIKNKNLNHVLGFRGTNTIVSNAQCSENNIQNLSALPPPTSNWRCSHHLVQQMLESEGTDKWDRPFLNKHPEENWFCSSNHTNWTNFIYLFIWEKASDRLFQGKTIQLNCPTRNKDSSNSVGALDVCCSAVNLKKLYPVIQKTRMN